MAFSLKNDLFGNLLSSDKFEAAINDPNFNSKAIKLFDLREDLWEAFKETKSEITQVSIREGWKKAKTPGRIAFAIGATAVTATFLMVGGPMIWPGALAVGILSIGVGLGMGGLTRGIVRTGPLVDGEEQIDEMSKRRQEIHSKIKYELEHLEDLLPSRTLEEREEFRSAFRHAALRQEIREETIHRKKVEKNTSEAARHARNASSAASIAAVGTAISIMRR